MHCVYFSAAFIASFKCLWGNNVRRTQGCAVLAVFEKRDDESKRQGGPSLHNRSTPTHRLPILSPPRSYGTRRHIEPRNYWEWSLKELLYFKQQSFVSSAARILRPVPGAGNHYGFHIISYQGMAVNIKTGARGDHLGPGASQTGSQLPPQTKHFPHHFSKRGIRKKRRQDTSTAQLWIFDGCLIHSWR